MSTILYMVLKKNPMLAGTAICFMSFGIGALASAVADASIVASFYHTAFLPMTFIPFWYRLIRTN